MYILVLPTYWVRNAWDFCVVGVDVEIFEKYQFRNSSRSSKRNMKKHPSEKQGRLLGTLRYSFSTYYLNFSFLWSKISNSIIIISMPTLLYFVSLLNYFILLIFLLLKNKTKQNPNMTYIPLQPLLPFKKILFECLVLQHPLKLRCGVCLSSITKYWD